MSAIGSLRVVMDDIKRLVSNENREHNGLPRELADAFDALTSGIETLSRKRGLIGPARAAQAIALRVQARKFYGDLLALPSLTTRL